MKWQYLFFLCIASSAAGPIPNTRVSPVDDTYLLTLYAPSREEASDLRSPQGFRSNERIKESLDLKRQAVENNGTAENGIFQQLLKEVFFKDESSTRNGEKRVKGFTGFVKLRQDDERGKEKKPSSTSTECSGGAREEGHLSPADKKVLKLLSENLKIGKGPKNRAPETVTQFQPEGDYEDPQADLFQILSVLQQGGGVGPENNFLMTLENGIKTLLLFLFDPNVSPEPLTRREGDGGNGTTPLSFPIPLSLPLPLPLPLELLGLSQRSRQSEPERYDRIKDQLKRFNFLKNKIKGVEDEGAISPKAMRGKQYSTATPSNIPFLHL